MSLFKIRLNPDDYYSKEEQEQIRKEVKEKYKEGKGKAKFLLDETLKSFDLEEKYSSKTSEEKKKEMAKAMIEYDEMFDEKRNEKYEGGILGDDRARYAEGPKDKVKKEDSFLGHLPMISDEIKQKVLEGNEDAKNYIAREYNMDMDALEMEINKFQEDRKNLSHGGGPLPNEGLEELHKEEPDLVAKMLRDGKAEGGDVDNQMSKLLNDLKEEQENLIPEPQMESDEEMEDNYMDFILDEALTEEEEDMLMSKLEQDEQLSMLFDKVVEVASEFAGSGPVRVRAQESPTVYLHGYLMENLSSLQKL